MKFKFIERTVPPVQNQKIVKDKDNEKKTAKTKEQITNTVVGDDSAVKTRTIPVITDKVITNSGENSQKVGDKKLESTTTKTTVPTTTETKETKIEIKRRTLKGSTKPIDFGFEVSPEQLSWTKQGELSVSPTFMTNEQPVIYSRATQAVLTMSSILFDSIHFPNKPDALADVTNLERLLSVDSDNFSPRVYDLFAETRKYGTFVISSLKINEIRRSSEGKPERIVVDLVLQPIPSYQIRTSQDLSMPAEILPEIIATATTTGTTAVGGGTSTASEGGCLVEKGTVISYTGDSGARAGANHVHLEARVNGQLTDPTAYSTNFKIGDKLLSTYRNTGSSSGFGATAGRSKPHQGVDYGLGVVAGMPISVDVDNLKLTYTGTQINATTGLGWGKHWKGTIGDVELLFAHNSRINTSLFSCTPASKASSNSGNKGGQVKPNTTKTTADNSSNSFTG